MNDVHKIIGIVVKNFKFDPKIDTINYIFSRNMTHTRTVFRFNFAGYVIIFGV